MQKIFISSLKPLFWVSSAVSMAIALQLPIAAQQDNIYHERDNLPDNADVFPRIGKIAGSAREQSNCRVTPWGRVTSRFSGNSFIDIDRRQVDSKGESWFHNPDRNCWIHDSRIDLL
ncbi:MAG: hypothetical protein SAJ12_10810 [Jaaginema sp. PMC 1079.18]|nr:hypothetical protein [Jaaginema sp. PMC 1080.18]MEC4851493.1 hypothetical protein [Jaaginema sp. PMC 1079.18]MEC4866959.1 hypothetical protein [Jaaginema sp. PMC 1078.18]